eukprot:NODE_1576_length_1486_cov_22.494781_g1422_i0.p1 GENE.NODE_1576_length_1486_cov_22.494781_g1422_i0~~NODE_1576_length_1486_cov_22.494781_g1422_i0.p1  ORF type:complete len:351 (+),score=36.74 NODE_1576_length_1486_cov_22.494781_g1422_i0:104-1156(+)
MTTTLQSTQSIMNHLLGQKLNLITNNDIRYEGYLSHIDSVGGTLSLQSVKVFGTEDRRGVAHSTNPAIPPSEDLFQLVVFKGSEVKDISLQSPSQRNLPWCDPAVVAARCLPVECNGKGPQQGDTHGSLHPPMHQGSREIFGSHPGVLGLSPAHQSAPRYHHAQAQAQTPAPAVPRVVNIDPRFCSHQFHRPASLLTLPRNVPSSRQPLVPSFPKSQPSLFRHRHEQAAQAQILSFRGSLRRSSNTWGSVPLRDFDFQSSNAKLDRDAIASEFHQRFGLPQEQGIFLRAGGFFDSQPEPIPNGKDLSPSDRQTPGTQAEGRGIEADIGCTADVIEPSHEADAVVPVPSLQ